MTIEELAKQRILILDGAMGTMIQQHKFAEEDFRGSEFKNHSLALKGNNDLLTLTQADVIKDIHIEYLKAGADIIETNTFSSNRISMADYNMESPEIIYRLNYESAQQAIRAREEYQKNFENRPIFIAGSIGPTNKTASISPRVNEPEYREVDFDQFADVYKEQTIALIEGGCDVILVETIFDTLNAKAAFYGIQDAFDQLNTTLPLMASGTITDKSGRTLSGQTTDAFIISLSHINLFSIGLNCALGAEDLRPYLQIMSKQAKTLISAYPNAGLPNAFGDYDETPEIMAQHMNRFLEDGIVNIIGGCCGTTPDHIRAMKEISLKYSPRKIEIRHV